RLAAAVDHLDECQSFLGGRGVERPLKELKRFAAYRRLRRHVKQSLLRKPTWQLINVTRQWVCPYCASATEIRIPTSSRMDDETLSALVDHVESCADYARGKGKERTLTELQDTIRNSNQLGQLARSVRDKLEGDPLWRRKDDRGRWVCPYCVEAQDSIDLSQRVVMFEHAPEQIARHLRTCQPYLEGQAPQPLEGVSSQSSLLRAVDDDEGDPWDESWSPEGSGRSRGKAPKTRAGTRQPPPFPVSDAEPLSLDLDDELPTAEVSEVGSALGSAKWGRDGDLTMRGVSGSGEDARRTLAELESSGEFLLIDDPEVRELTKGRPQGDIAGWREEIERSLATVRSGSSSRLSRIDVQRAAPVEPVPGAPDLSGYGLEVGLLGEEPDDDPSPDFAAVLPLGRGRLGLVAGSVSGDVGEAPMLAKLTLQRISESAGPDTDPATLLKRVNRQIFKDLDGRSFVAVCFALVDLATSRLRLARAGGPEPLVVQASHGLRVVDCEGMVMGVDQGPAFEGHLASQSLALGPDSLLVIYANGVLETRGREGRELGLERVQELVERYGTHEVEYFTDKFREYYDLHVQGTLQTRPARLVALKRSPSA
ncbi:MAG TPA: hypothetical protein DEA08_35665, partial [Planctomycetes bacterium]|nr:hypothetical protein [Planctomycetota bacterium]